MKRLVITLSVFALSVGACGGNASQPAPKAAAFAEDSRSVTIQGLTVTRPDGWVFRKNSAESPQGEFVLIGPTTSYPSRAAVYFYREPVPERAQRSHPERLLTNWTVSIIQLFQSAKMASEPESMEIAGHPGARLAMDISEMESDGSVVPLKAHFYGIVDGDQFWAIYSVAPPDGSADRSIADVIDSIEL